MGLKPHVVALTLGLLDESSWNRKYSGGNMKRDINSGKATKDNEEPLWHSSRRPFSLRLLHIPLGSRNEKKRKGMKYVHHAPFKKAEQWERLASVP